MRVGAKIFQTFRYRDRTFGREETTCRTGELFRSVARPLGSRRHHAQEWIETHINRAWKSVVAEVLEIAETDKHHVAEAIIEESKSDEIAMVISLQV